MCDIKVVNPAVLKSIESFMSDSAYREALENSTNYNTRICIERRLRMPFLDSQTGVAQNHCNLFMSQRQRMPGLREGQIYTYPSKPWRKKRRQYLMNFISSRRKDNDSDSNDMHTISTVENPAIVSNEDSKDSSSKDETTAKVAESSWYYDEMDMHDLDGFDEPDADSDMDYEEPSKRRKGKSRSKPASRQSPAVDSPSRRGPSGGGSRSSAAAGRGRRKNMAYADLTDTDKPFSCDLCGARYKTRPGLTYHYTHSHKEGRVCTVQGDEDASQEGPPSSPANKDKSPAVPTASGAVSPASMTPPQAGAGASTNSASANLAPPAQAGISAEQGPGTPAASPSGSSAKKRHPSSTPSPSSGGVDDSSQKGFPEEETDGKTNSAKDPDALPVLKMDGREKAAPSPYCDFCLGDAVANKKSGQPEELVSCSDCGRSGHPTCLQFTNNMIVSVRKYRWQCIECKCCSICGTSDNDDQLLFCDDCDRGYHMYCLSPPLSSPPEGSWSCRLCLKEFHSK
ncbi:zinc finger protein ubi-d4 B isoform X2 [Bemisia tabaci]|uniref:zinc finger protein ubi-d4 B isoform X2 n=1 Tax=Bemisia tabaci TaxID=7038 RepID=UPI0008F9B1F8|nr:PREDICTED: zinc finger protein ubi-d4 B isoform X2 [Bemisia tabaci]